MDFSLCVVFFPLGFCIEFSDICNFSHKFFGGGLVFIIQLYLCVAFGFHMPWNDSFVMFSLGIVEETLLLLCSCYIMLSCTIIFNVLCWFLF